MKEILTANGWVKYYECNCSGGKQYWNNKSKPGYEIRTKTKTNTFSIVFENRIVAGPFYGYQLEEKLKQHVN